MTAGRFSEGLASWRRVIASVPDIDNRLTIFDNAAADIGTYVANGLDKLTAVDELQEMASAYGLVDAAGDDEIQSIIAAAIARGEQQAEIVPDELEQPKTNGGTPPKRVELVRASDIEQRPISWLWYPRLARGKLSLIAGDPGVGKSSLATDVIARVSAAGRTWPDGGQAPHGTCIMLSAEDAPDDTVCPRLEVAGADLDRVMIMRMAGGGPGTKRTFNLGQDLPLLATAIERLGNDVALLTIDPVTSYLGDKIDTHQTAAVRAVLEPLDAFAAHYRVAILGVTHPPKAAQSKAIHAFTGSLAFVAAARTCFVAVSEAETDRRLLLPVKSNIGPTAAGIAYRLQQAHTSKNIETIRVNWDDGPVDITASEALQAADDPARGGSKRAAEQFLEGYLEAGPMLVEKVQAAAKANGISERTLDRAKKTLRVVSEKAAFGGGWTWRLPR